MWEFDFTPICTILAGPNGSGKSSAAQLWLTVPGEVVNADVIARLINPDKPEAASVAAGGAVLKRLDQLIEQRQNFNFETTLSSHQALQLMERAKSAGFKVVLIFVTLETVEMNVRRVRQRVAQGGHSIPEHVIRRRYHKTFERLSEAIVLADEAEIIDNSKASPEALRSVCLPSPSIARAGASSYFPAKSTFVKGIIGRENHLERAMRTTIAV